MHRQAKDLINHYSKRSRTSRRPCEPDNSSQLAFYKVFPFTPTPDQIQCFEDVMQDMVWYKQPMDRLVCGDVGFGKTEVSKNTLYSFWNDLPPRHLLSRANTIIRLLCELFIVL